MVVLEYWREGTLDLSKSTMEPTVTDTPTNPYVEALTLYVTVFGDTTFKEVIKVKWSHKDEAKDTTEL